MNSSYRILNLLQILWLTAFVLGQICASAWAEDQELKIFAPELYHYFSSIDDSKEPLKSEFRLVKLAQILEDIRTDLKSEDKPASRKAVSALLAALDYQMWKISFGRLDSSSALESNFGVDFLTEVLSFHMIENQSDLELLELVSNSLANGKKSVAGQMVRVIIIGYSRLTEEQKKSRLELLENIFKGNKSFLTKVLVGIRENVFGSKPLQDDVFEILKGPLLNEASAQYREMMITHNALVNMQDAALEALIALENISDLEFIGSKLRISIEQGELQLAHKIVRSLALCPMLDAQMLAAKTALISEHEGLYFLGLSSLSNSQHPEIQKLIELAKSGGRSKVQTYLNPGALSRFWMSCKKLLGG